MQLTSLNGTSYTSTKRTTPRDHQADLAARSHSQTKQQKREGSLARLKSDLAGYERSVEQFLSQPGKGTTELLEETRIERRKRTEAKIVNLKRMIEQTEAAIAHNR